MNVIKYISYLEFVNKSKKNLTFIYKYGIIITRWKGDASLNTDWFFCFLENQARQFICNKKVETSRGFGFFSFFFYNVPIHNNVNNNIIKCG